MIIKKTIKNKIALPVTLGLLMASSLAPMAAHAATAVPNISPTSSGSGSAGVVMVSTDQTKLNNIIAKGNTAISNRLTTLNNLISVVKSTTNKLTPSDQAYLLTEIKTEISGLTTLQTQLDAETSLSAAQTDYQNIFLQFRVYALIAPKVTMIKAADDQQVTEGLLSGMSIKLQYRINLASSAGHDVTQLQNWLDTMGNDTTYAQGNSSSVETTVLPLLPTQYDSNHSILSSDYAQLKQARQDNTAAYALAQEIVSGLKSL